MRRPDVLVSYQGILMGENRMPYLGDFVEALARRTWARGVPASMSQEDVATQALSAPPLERATAAAVTLMGKGGDAARVAVAEQALMAYADMDEADRGRFFALLRDEFGIDEDAVHRAYARWDEDPSASRAADLVEVVEPRRQELLRRLNLTDGATLRLVQMRADLLRSLRDDPSLKAVDQDFSHLFASWFNRGFLEKRRIDWTTAAATLEKIKAYEAVHPMQGWDDLRRRMEPTDRRLAAFFHPATGDEPLIFVEVALTRDVPDSIAEILTAPVPDGPVEADTAVFYSINNTQAGLKGVSFGNFLIKQVVADLATELPDLRTFVTLSPATGFAAWLAASDDPRDTALSTRLAAGDWVSDPASIGELRPVVLEAAARYIITARDGRGRPVDPTARFHLGNGASVWRLNWPADLSSRALTQAHGLMVNYLYEPARIEAQHEAFMRDGTIAHSQLLADTLQR